MKHEIYKAIGQRIKEIRKRQGKTVKELAELVGVTRPSLSNLENGAQGVSIFKLYLIAKGLNCKSIDEIFPINQEYVDPIISKFE